MLRFLLPKTSLKRKILDIKDDIKKAVRPFCSEKYYVSWYGAYDIDPQNLVFWVHVKTDKIKNELQSNLELQQTFRDILEINNYPFKARKNIHIGVESQETVDRESNGNWRNHFQ